MSGQAYKESSFADDRFFPFDLLGPAAGVSSMVIPKSAVMSALWDTIIRLLATFDFFRIISLSCLTTFPIKSPILIPLSVNNSCGFRSSRLANALNSPNEPRSPGIDYPPPPSSIFSVLSLFSLSILQSRLNCTRHKNTPAGVSTKTQGIPGT